MAEFYYKLILLPTKTNSYLFEYLVKQGGKNIFFSLLILTFYNLLGQSFQFLLKHPHTNLVQVFMNKYVIFSHHSSLH